MFSSGEPVKVMTGLPLLVRVSSAPVSVASVMSIDVSTFDEFEPGFVAISNEPMSELLPAIVVAWMVYAPSPELLLLFVGFPLIKSPNG